MDWDRVIEEARKSVLLYEIIYLENWYLMIISKHRCYVPFRTCVMLYREYGALRKCQDL
jgi:hypothetical protein